ncbi:MAG: PilN domain-containing protein [bacterium]|nr:PilN domain-containing protein [bacterium]
MVRIFTINLNKGEGEIVLRQRRQERRSFLLLFLMGLVFAVLGGITWAQNGAINDVITSRRDKLERIKYELDSLKREGTNVSKDDVMALANLETERFLWARRLEVLAEVLPPGMSVTGLELNNNRLILNCIAQVDSSEKEFDIISSFVDLLKTTPDFRQGMFEIKFDKSLRKVVEDQDALMFSVECITRDPERGKKKKSSSVLPTPSKTIVQGS